VALQDGFDRVLDCVQKDEFLFVVNGESIKSTVLGAVLLSPKIHENLRSVPGAFTFNIDDTRITANDFQAFLEFVHSRVLPEFSQQTQFSFVSICEHLGNDGLTSLMIGSSKSEIDGSNFYCYSTEMIRRLNKRTLHELLCSPSLKIESEDSLLGVLIELGSDYFEYWCYIEVTHLTDEGLSLFIDNLAFEHLSESIWKKIVDRCKGNRDSELISSRYVHSSVVAPDSMIVKHCPSILSEFSKHKWNLLYRGSRDGFTASDFHLKCDNQSNTLTLIETTKGFIFGGFTPIAWDSSSGDKYDSSNKSFLFSLKNPRNADPRKFQMFGAKRTICCSAGYGPIFGHNSDIRVDDHCNAPDRNYTNLGSSFVNDTGIDGRQVFAGEHKFTVKELEVFTITL
jgi:hypothetical protein